MALITVLCVITFKHYQWTSCRIFVPDFRLQGFYSNPNYYALAIILVWSMMISFIRYAKDCQSRTCANFALVSLSTVALIATYIRTSWIGMICTLLIALYYARSKKAAYASVAAFTLFIIAAALNFFELKDAFFTPSTS